MSTHDRTTTAECRAISLLGMPCAEERIWSVRRSCLLFLVLVAALVIAATGGAAATDSGAGGRIAFTRQVGERGQVFVFDVASRVTRQITREPTYHAGPDLSADARSLAYGSSAWDRGAFYPSKIVIVDLGTGRRSVPLLDPRSSSGDLAHVVQSPALSPNGRRLCFTDQGWNIAVVPSIGRSSHWPPLALGTDCAWSPDGQWIVFTRLVLGPTPDESDVYVHSQGIWRIRPDGTGLRRVTSASDWEPDWSPDGKRIAFSRRTTHRGGVRWDIVVAQQTGTGARRLSEGTSPSWSPDGRQIAFVRRTPDFRQFDIYVMSANGSRQRLLLSDAASPSWGPR